MYFIRTPGLLRSFFPGLVWKIPAEKTLYLTFDDGPTPGITENILGMLEDYRAHATFFCVGANAEKNPGLLEHIRAGGHAVGNHTWDHRDGWKTPASAYYENVMRCSELLGTNLFRPPYGRITYTQIRKLRADFRIVMWDVLSGDFDARLRASRCAENVTRHAKTGSIIVFHDSEKARERVLGALPAVLACFSEKGFRFEKIAAP